MDDDHLKNMRENSCKVLMLLVFVTWSAALYCGYCYWNELKLYEKIYLELVVVIMTPPLGDLSGIFKKNK